jgi:DNA-directed RNA polymerase specialized sigma24 family protein
MGPHRNEGFVSAPESTCWTMIRAAAAGNAADREELARRYLGVVRAYLTARWRGTALREEVEDATQAVFLECFRAGGVLDAVDADRVCGFRAFLYGVIRNVAVRVESRPVRTFGVMPEIEADEAAGSRLFDRTWARAIMAEAAASQRAEALGRGAEAVHRVELLRLRFEENRPIREIARLWNTDPAKLHHAYALARQEFKEALLEVIAFHQPGSKLELEQEAASLLQALS